MRNRYLLLADLVAVLIAAWAAFAFRFGWDLRDERAEVFVPFVVLALLIKSAAFLGFGMYRRYWRYAGFWDLLSVVLANSAASILLAGVMVFGGVLGWHQGLSRSIPPLDWLFALALTLGIRATVRAVSETMTLRPRAESDRRRNRRVLIIGAGDAGALVAREMQKNPQLGLSPVGFLDDDRVKVRKQIYGLRVLGEIDALQKVAESQRVDEVVIAIPTVGGRVVRDVVEQCQSLGIPSRVVPGIYELLDGNVSVNRLRSVDIADLLRRPPTDAQSARPEYLNGACVIVTGAGGSIGSELCRQVAHASPKRLLLLGHGENSIFEIGAELKARFPNVQLESVIADVRDRERISRIFRQVQPDVIFHAAAHKHLPLMEENPAEAVTNNIGGTRNVVEAAVAAGVQRFVMVSTDKAVAPTSMMGASKRIAERIVHRAARVHGRAFVVVRFGNVLGSRGSVVPVFKRQIEQGGPVTVTHPDVRRYFMTISEAVHLILQAGGVGRGGELFVLDMGEPVLLREMAADMIRLSGLGEADVPIVFTGLRHGEKLNELLWEEGAIVETTARVDIRRVREPGADDDEMLDGVLERFAEAAARDDNDRIARLFTECIPSATLPAGRREPQHSGVVLKLPRA